MFFLVVLLLLGCLVWMLARALIRRFDDSFLARMSPVTGAYLAALGAWCCVIVFIALTAGPAGSPSSGGCDLIDCLDADAAEDLFYFMFLGPPYFIFSFAGMGLAVKALRQGEQAAASLWALALSAAGPLAYAFMAIAYG